MPAKPLHGRVAVLTGSTGGLGFAIAEGLAFAGCRIMLNGLETPATVERMRAELEDRSGVSVGYRGQMSAKLAPSRGSLTRVLNASARSTFW
jgi:3-hydroxybutyrate dehydrogenase